MMKFFGIFAASTLALAGRFSAAQDAAQCAALGAECYTNGLECCDPVHDCEEGFCNIRFFLPTHGQACEEDCACALLSEECIDNMCQPIGECANDRDKDCSNAIPCCNPDYECIGVDFSYGFGNGFCEEAAARTGEACIGDDSCRFEFDSCVDGLCKVSPSFQEDVVAKTRVTTSANAWDPRVTGGGGCGSDGCRPGLARDGSTDLESRWSCSTSLGKGECYIEFSFDSPQDVLSMNIAFHKGDTRVRTVEVFGDGSSLGEFTSSGTTVGYENWTLNAKDVTAIKIIPKYLGNDWISLTEVQLLGYRYLC